jgi:hypothetical protein
LIEPRRSNCEIGIVFVHFIMMSQSRSRAGRGRGRISLALILSYVVDWLVIIAAAGIGAAFSVITPNKRPFSLDDANISFPYDNDEKISTALLAVCALAAPAAIIFLISILSPSRWSGKESYGSGILDGWAWHCPWRLHFSLRMA